MSWIHYFPTLTLALVLAVSPLHSQYIQVACTCKIIVDILTKMQTALTKQLNNWIVLPYQWWWCSYEWYSMCCVIINVSVAWQCLAPQVLAVTAAWEEALTAAQTSWYLARWWTVSQKKVRVFVCWRKNKVMFMFLWWRRILPVNNSYSITNFLKPLCTVAVMWLNFVTFTCIMLCNSYILFWKTPILLSKLETNCCST